MHWLHSTLLKHFLFISLVLITVRSWVNPRVYCGWIAKVHLAHQFSNLWPSGLRHIASPTTLPHTPKKIKNERNSAWNWLAWECWNGMLREGKLHKSLNVERVFLCTCQATVLAIILICSSESEYLCNAGILLSSPQNIYSVLKIAFSFMSNFLRKDTNSVVKNFKYVVSHFHEQHFVPISRT
jgi:hypothetical protein